MFDLPQLYNWRANIVKDFIHRQNMHLMMELDYLFLRRPLGIALLGNRNKLYLKLLKQCKKHYKEYLKFTQKHRFNREIFKMSIFKTRAIISRTKIIKTSQ